MKSWMEIIQEIQFFQTWDYLVSLVVRWSSDLSSGGVDKEASNPRSMNCCSCLAVANSHMDHNSDVNSHFPFHSITRTLNHLHQALRKLIRKHKILPNRGDLVYLVKRCLLDLSSCGLANETSDSIEVPPPPSPLQTKSQNPHIYWNHDPTAATATKLATPASSPSTTSNDKIPTMSTAISHITTAAAATIQSAQTTSDATETEVPSRMSQLIAMAEATTKTVSAGP